MIEDKEEKILFLRRTAMLAAPATLAEAYAKKLGKYDCQNFSATQYAAEQAYIFAEAMWNQDKIRKEMCNGKQK